MEASSSYPYLCSRIKGTLNRMPRPYREDSPDSLFIRARDEHYHSGHAAQRRRLEIDVPRLRAHYPGDGLEFRRPAMSTAEVAGNNSMEQRSNQTTVIDLTEEDATRARQHTFTPSARTASHPHSGEGSSHVQRLPRFSRDVIDIDSDDEAEEHDTSQLPGRNYLAIPSRRVRPQFANLTTPAPPPSPPREMDDVEFLAERPRSRPRSRSRISSVVMTPPRHRSLTPYPRNAGATVDLTQDNEDEVMHVQTRPLEGINRELPAPADGLGAGYHFGHMGNIVGMLREGGAHIGGRLAQRLQIWPGMGAEIQAQHQALQPYAFEAQNRRPNFHPPANQFPRTHLPGAIDYDLAAFDLRTNNTREQTYSPPPKPSKGFTRSPTEDDIVVCPNCGDELAKGASELKQEVWVVKTCGHAYCGDCAQSRNRSSSKKGKSKAPALPLDPSLPRPFKKCVVQDCGKTTTRNAMVHVYIGS